MATSCVASWVLALVLIAGSLCNVDALCSNYYADSCPAAETTIANIVIKAIKGDKRIGAGLLRLLFHDCFVEGCDASVLIDSPNGDAEKDAVPNQTLHDLDVIDNAKAAVEAICPHTVSCADIVAFSAATSVKVLGGPVVDLLGGRLDGYVSNINDANNNIPSPFFTLNQLKTSFASKGLDTHDLVTLSGAHTIGKSHCGPVLSRLRNFSSTADTDPSLDPKLANSLKAKCPPNPSANTLLNMDIQTPTVFDNKYYQVVQTEKGLFTSDAQLYTSSETIDKVNYFADSNPVFLESFAGSLFKMAQVGIKTGYEGNIRTNCRSFS